MAIKNYKKWMKSNTNEIKKLKIMVMMKFIDNYCIKSFPIVPLRIEFNVFTNHIIHSSLHFSCHTFSHSPSTEYELY